MLSDHIATQIYSYFGFEPTLEQKNLIAALASYIVSSGEDSLFVVNGYAGTGKTTLIGALVKALGQMEIKSVLMAPTGRAAKVMSGYCDTPAFTIHKKIYRQKKLDGEQALFDLNINKDNNTIYIVDEASMLSNNPSETSAFGSGRLIDDMIDYIRTGRDNRLIIVGDDAQLPPVGFDFSPALNPLHMERYGTVDYASLTEVVRQGKDSGILHNATAVRRMLDDGEIGFPDFDTDFKDIFRIPGSRLMESLQDSYASHGTEGTAIVTRSNKRANRYNQGVRASILGYDEEICSGDILMVVKNNYFYVGQDESSGLEFIANGDVAVVRRIYGTEEVYGFRFAEVKLSFPDYGDYQMECLIMLDTLHSESPSLTREQSSRLFYAIEEDYLNIKNRSKRYKEIQQNKYYNALQVKFGYAATCHKAQGGQWPNVFVDTMIFGDEQMTRDFQRWMYTAITRATEKLYLVNWDKRFFGGRELEEEW